MYKRNQGRLQWDRPPLDEFLYALLNTIVCEYFLFSSICPYFPLIQQAAYALQGNIRILIALNTM